MEVRSVSEDELATNGPSYLWLLASDANWIARNLADVTQLRSTAECALSKLDEESFNSFKGSLEFKRNGLAHADYSSLRKLSISEIVEIFRRFGISGAYFLDQKDYKCQGAGNCLKYNDYICTSAC